MTEPAPIFRQEALDFRSGVRRERTDLRLGHPWTGLVYRLVLAVGFAALVICWAVRTEATTSGPASVDPRAGTFTAFVPAAAGPEVSAGQAVRLRLTGAGKRTYAGQVVQAEATDGAEVPEPGMPSAPGPVVLVSGVLQSGADAGVVPPSGPQPAQAVVVVRSERLLDLLVDGVIGLFAEGGDG